MGSGHGHSSSLRVPTTTSRRLAVVSAVVGLLTLVGLVVLWPSGDITSSLNNFTTTFFDARVDRVEVVPCPGLPAGEDTTLRCAELDVELLEGPDQGGVVPLDVFDASSANFSVGETVVVEYDERAPEGFQYRFSDRQRTPVLVWLAVLFAVSVVVLGRWRGLAALVGLGMSLAVLLVFTVPALVEGSDPLVVALVSAAAISYAAIYLAHGFNSMSTVALLGTLASLALTAVLATVFVQLAGITGLASEQASFLQLGSVEVGLQGLVLAGIVIGALGALDDMTVTQASAVWELRAAAGPRSIGQLYRSGIRIGRDHVASTVNTLVLAYAGASMPLLLFFSLTSQSLGVVANGELVATEIVRTLVGSIGLVASVPLTTALAAWTASQATSSAVVGADGPHDGRPDIGPDDDGPVTRPAP
jgi:uncharacterized membrane protein